MVFFEITTLKIPFEKCDDLKVLEMLGKDNRDEIPSTVNLDVRTLIQEMWNPNHEARPTSGQVLIQLNKIEEIRKIVKPSN